jgi:hypothetical protein
LLALVEKFKEQVAIIVGRPAIKFFHEFIKIDSRIEIDKQRLHLLLAPLAHINISDCTLCLTWYVHDLLIPLDTNGFEALKVRVALALKKRELAVLRLQLLFTLLAHALGPARYAHGLLAIVPLEARVIVNTTLLVPEAEVVELALE